jgi:2-dehydropantoate 2-reductase
MNTGVLVVGSGALATLFAARLAASGVKVTVLGTWTEGLAALRTSGAHLDGEGSFVVRASDNPHDCMGAEIALVLVKSWQTKRAACQLADCMGEDGLVVTFQNGLGNDEILSGVLGRQRVFQGITTLGAVLLEPGYVRQNGEGVVFLENHPKLISLREILRVANFSITGVDDILPNVWTKLIINTAINPLTALLRVKNGELLNIPSARNLMGEIARETASIAKALGIPLPISTPENVVEDVARRTSENTSSMLQDVLRGAPTEVDAINGAVVRKGEEKKVCTTANRVLWSLIKAISTDGKISSFIKMRKGEL